MDLDPMQLIYTSVCVQRAFGGLIEEGRRGGGKEEREHHVR
jgi:hypothetical protein